MINFNENLYTSQWLDLVFQNRNKSYGAYELRKHNNETTTRAFWCACILMSSLVIIPWMYLQIAPKVPPIDIPELPEPIEVSMTKINEPKPVLPPSQLPPRQQQLRSVQYTQMVVAPASETDIEPPNQLQVAQSVISTLTADGADATGINPMETTAPANGGGIADVISENTIYSIDGIEKYPVFPGGQEAFAKFLSRNLRYPGTAASNGIQGKVLVSFVIERNGSLSNIKILRSIGGGCYEEAMRVLAKSPQWQPGVQNNQNVRVAYTIPINFKMPD